MGTEHLNAGVRARNTRADKMGEGGHESPPLACGPGLCKVYGFRRRGAWLAGAAATEGAETRSIVLGAVKYLPRRLRNWKDSGATAAGIATRSSETGKTCCANMTPQITRGKAFLVVPGQISGVGFFPRRELQVWLTSHVVSYKFCVLPTW